MINNRQRRGVVDLNVPACLAGGKDEVVFTVIYALLHQTLTGGKNRYRLCILMNSVFRLDAHLNRSNGLSGWLFVDSSSG